MICAIVWTYNVVDGPADALTPHIATTGIDATVGHIGTAEMRDGSLLAVAVVCDSIADIEAVGYGDAIARRLDGSKMIEARP